MLNNVTAYACVFSDTFSFQKDIDFRCFTYSKICVLVIFEHVVLPVVWQFSMRDAKNEHLFYILLLSRPFLNKKYLIKINSEGFHGG